MKRRSKILSIVTLTVLLAGIMLAQGIAEKAEEEKDVQVRAERGRGMMGAGRMQIRGGGMGLMGRGMQRGRMADHAGILLRLADKLDLSEEQKAELKELYTSHQKDAIRLKADREIARVELQEAMRADEPDLEAIEDQLRGIANLEVEAKLSRIKTRMDAKSVLTEEQQEKLKELLKDRPAHKKAGRQARSGSTAPRRGRSGRSG